MVPEREERRLAAILCADVAGYSRLMGADESGTLAQLKAARKELIDPAVADRGGRIVNATGDGLLVEFASVVDAVACAATVQRALAGHNADVPENIRLEFRICINLGDVIVEKGDIFGDGVNIAARLEALAEPGGICISEDAFRQVRGRTDLAFRDLGERVHKNIVQPVRVYRVSSVDAPGVAQPVADRALESGLPDKPSIAVLPFDNMSDDRAQEYFADGISEDIITLLSKVSELFVIARNSSFTFKGKAVKVETVSAELGVRYILEGSVRKAGDRVRITAQLVDGTTGGHLWAERYDRDLQDVFAVQDEVAQKIVAALEIRLTEREERELARAEPADIEAYDTLLRAREQFFRYTLDGNTEARRLFETAVGLDAAYADAHVGLAQTYLLEAFHGWSAAPDQSQARARALVEHALDLDPSLPSAHGALSAIYLFEREHDKALAEAKKGIALEPSNADGYADLAAVLAWMAQPEEALALIEKAMALNPHYPEAYAFVQGHAHFLMRHYRDAASAFRKSIELNPEFSPNRSFLAATYFYLGEADKARSELQALATSHPELTEMDEAAALRSLPYMPAPKIPSTS